MRNHLELVRDIADHFPPNNNSLDTLLPFVVRVVAALPKDEGAGLLRKDGGENIAFYAPAGVNVSISRVCYPDGTIVKVLTDAGVGGANGPAWNVEAVRVDPARCVPLTATPPPPPRLAYPGDAYFITAIGSVLAADYAEAHQALNAGSATWFARVIWDIVNNGLTPTESVTKHRAEWRAALGLK